MNSIVRPFGAWTVAVLGICLLGLTACEEDAPTNNSKAGTFYGASKTMGNGTARTFVVLDDAGNPTEIGVAMNAAAMEGLPDDPFTPDAHVMFALPSQATDMAVNHLEIDWNPDGHDPQGIYDNPHFDFHFYLIDTTARNMITGQGDDTVKFDLAPPANQLPPDYISPPGGFRVPRMGRHWVDSTSPEFHGHAFDKSFIYGTYNGKVVFFEPMVTKAYLLSKPNVTDSLKLPTVYPSTGYYPTTYSVRYNATTSEYIVALGGLKKR